LVLRRSCASIDTPSCKQQRTRLNNAKHPTHILLLLFARCPSNHLSLSSQVLRQHLHPFLQAAAHLPQQPRPQASHSQNLRQQPTPLPTCKNVAMVVTAVTVATVATAITAMPVAVMAAVGAVVAVTAPAPTTMAVAVPAAASTLGPCGQAVHVSCRRPHEKSMPAQHQQQQQLHQPPRQVTRLPSLLQR
jgi:hypothetical protein